MAVRMTLALLAGALLLGAGCGGDDDETASTPASKPATKPAKAVIKDGCKVVDAPAAKANGGQHKPTAALAPAKTYEVVMTTSCGSFTIRLEQKLSPNATASFAALVRSGFYDDTIFHRIVPGFVVQGGDPTGIGTGGPGYSTRDKPALDTAYLRGVVAMAKAGNEPAGTAGSQFYVVTAADSGLTPDYAVLGKVVKGMAAVLRMERLGDPAAGDRGAPRRPVVLEKAKLVER